LDDPWATYAGGSPFPAVYDTNAKYTSFGGMTVMPYHLDPSQTQNWNIAVQRQLGSDFLVSASYLGSHVIHMLMTAPLNPAIYFPGVSDATGKCLAQGYTFTTTPNTACSSTTNTNNRRILSLIDFQRTGQFVGNLAEYQSVGKSGYNGMLLDLRKRASHGITINANYTWSHCISSDQDTLNGSLYDSGTTYIYLKDRNRGISNCSIDRR
jgi:hypothetical protein